jgi:hypothetical protein
MKLIARVQTMGSYGQVASGEAFECEDAEAGYLIRMGYAIKAGPPRILYEKAAPEQDEKDSREKGEAQEVASRPFRDGIVRDAEPPSVVAEGNRVLPVANVSEARAAYHRGRGRRAGRAARR